MARKTERKYGSAANRAKAAAAVAGPGGGGGTMFRNLGEKVEFFNPEVPKGKTEIKYTIRIVPYVVSDPKHPDGKDNAPVGDIWYKRSFKRYRQLGPEGSKKAYISPLSVGMPDPVAEYYAAGKADPSIDDKALSPFKPQDCVMYNVQIMDEKTKEFGDILFWWFSYACFEKRLKKELLDPDNEKYLSFMDLEDGYDLRVRFQKESFQGNDFISADSITFLERDDLDESILDEVVDLDNCLVIKPYKELRSIFLELDEEDTDDKPDEHPEDKPEPRAPRERKKAEPEPEPEKPTRRGRGEKKDPEPEPQSERPARGRRRQEPDPEPQGPECPHGFVFGDDFDTKRKCEQCDLFDECGDKFEADHPPKDEKKTGKGSKSETEEKSTGKAGGKPSGKSDCPHGHVFGTDCDNKSECNDCPKWDDCMDRQEELEKE